MNKKIFLAVIVIIAVAAWFAAANKNKSKENTSASQVQTGSNANPDNGQAAEQPGNVLTGTLKVSSNKTLGNLMLVTDTQVVYIRTSRDFTALIGKNVKVTFEGDLTSFKLLTIEPLE